MRLQKIASRVLVAFGLVAASAAGASAAVFVLERGVAPRVSADPVEAAPVARTTKIRNAPFARRSPTPPPTPAVESPRFDARGTAEEPRPSAPSGILALGGLAVPDADREVAAPEPVEPAVPRWPSRTRSRGLDASAVRAVVSAGMPGLRRCYERSSRRAGFGLEVSVELAVRYAPNGAVRAVFVSGADPALASCLEVSASSWTFPPSAGGAVTVPVRLRPRW